MHVVEGPTAFLKNRNSAAAGLSAHKSTHHPMTKRPTKAAWYTSGKGLGICTVKPRSNRCIAAPKEVECSKPPSASPPEITSAGEYGALRCFSMATVARKMLCNESPVARNNKMVSIPSNDDLYADLYAIRYGGLYAIRCDEQRLTVIYLNVD
eukprot:3730198-Prymnesium_polylepis.1